MLDANHYREQAAQMRKFAAEAPNETMREKFLNLAAEYDKLATRAAVRKLSPRRSQVRSLRAASL